MIDGFIKGSESVYPVFFDEAGHRVAIQYMMAALNGFMPPESLLHYREFDKGLYGHPERHDDMGIFFSSGRLGHMWSYVNGIAAANSGKSVILFAAMKLVLKFRPHRNRKIIAAALVALLVVAVRNVAGF